MEIPPWLWTWPGWAAVAAVAAAGAVVVTGIQASLMRRQLRIQERQRREDAARAQTPDLSFEVLGCRYEDRVHCFACRLYADGGGTASSVSINVTAVGDRALQVAGGTTVPFIRAPGHQDVELLVGGLRGYPLGERVNVSIIFMNRFRTAFEIIYEGLFFAGMPGETDPELRFNGPAAVTAIDCTFPKRRGYVERARMTVWAWWMRRRGQVSITDLTRYLINDRHSRRQRVKL